MAAQRLARHHGVAVLLLLVFALIAGAGTAITPCVLPVVPALLSASGAGGRRRPLGIVLGLGITFVISIVALAQLVKGVGLGSTAARDLAVVVLIVFGLVMLIPELAQRVEAPLSRLARFGPKTRGDGFLTGVGVGAALGFCCAPCAGPILSAVTSVSASSGPTASVVATAVAYAVGLCAVMLVYAFAGRAALTRIRRVARGRRVERTLGVILLLTGVAMAFNVDARLDTFIANHQHDLPGFLFDPTQSIESSHQVKTAIATDLRSQHRHALAKGECTQATVNQAIPSFVDLQGVTTPKLGCDGKAPKFTDNQDWFNTPGDRPLTIASLKGKVVLVDFWTYTCINCIRTLPFIEGLYKTYHKYGLEIVGVETPEFTFEQDAANVRQAIKTDGITYPVVQDNDYGTWNAYNNNSWPADYLIDANGEIRHMQVGEGAYEQEEAAVRALLYEAGDRHLPAPTTAKAVTPSEDLGSYETYLNPERSAEQAQEGEVQFVQPLELGTRNYYATARPDNLKVNQWQLKGTWRGVQPADTNDEGYITPTSSGASITGTVLAKDVYLVMTTRDDRPITGRVLLNGVPIPSQYAGSAVRRGGYFTVTTQTLYNLVNLPRDGQFSITVEVPKGISAYDFTFG